ncbi:Hairy/enhancer-of-split with YRPW motif protein 2 [Mucor velutinosus]|uniref:Actin cytoskeleton-regulatory complex protein SLA1 n=2 Tax=Mucor TaxID=4830 RepID=A0AAN7DF84_9FUNG|nr:Hairy/enhancer-of-split with YRPW motif protein 2 [Mucor velutinosus]
MKYVAICSALYDYQAQVDDEELSFNADDILYILENNDPDWYKAQLKVPSAPDGGPIGIIPSNYVEKAKPIGTVKAIYDYQPQSVEEVELKEDEVLTLYENDDPDWFVVEKSNGDIGLAPSNYVEQQEQQGATINNVEKTLPAVASASPWLNTPATTNTASASPVLNRSDSALSWSVHEYDVIKKKKTKSKGNLLVGNGMFCYGSETDKSSPVRQFQVNQVLTASIDGKNVHIEMNDAQHSVFDFQTASQSEAKGILAKIESSKTASNAAVGLALPSPAAMTTSPSPVSVHTPSPAPAPATQVSPVIQEPASANPTPACEPKWAIALFPFKPEAGEETYLEEHEQVLITDYVNSTDWWTIEHKDGTAGIVPANYVKFQDEYEADLRAEEAEEEKKRLEAAAAAAAKEAEMAARQKQQETEEKERKRKQEEDQREQQRQKEMAELNRQRDLEEKERARQAEVDRRRKMQEEAKQKELDAKRQANLAATAMASPQMGGGSPRRSQIPAPPPPSHTAPSPSLPTYNQQQPPAPKHTDPNKPDPAKVRMWTDRTGAFKVEAQFLSCANGKIRLFKTNGVKIDVPTQKMCIEDLKYIEQETGIKQYEDTNDNIPLAQLNNNSSSSKFSWFDYFKKANLPHSACVEYAGNFDANKLTEHDVERLTHRKMKLLGMSEKHVQRIQRFIETNQAEPPSDNEGTQSGGLARPKMKVKKSVTFGAVSYIHEDGDSDNEDDVQWQIEQDEILARQLQEQEQNGGGGGSSSLHRRGTGRPTPSHSAPRDVSSSVLTPQKFEPLKPVQASPVQSLPQRQQHQQQQQREITPLVAQPVHNNNTAPPKPAFEDDAWAPRAGSSPSVQAANAASPAWNSAQQSNTVSPNIASPARQRPTPQLSQQSMVDPQLLAKWGGSPALAAANSRPVPPPPTTATITTPNTNFAPLQRSVTMQPQTTGFQPQGSMTSLPTMLNHGSTASLPTLQPQASMTSLPQMQQPAPATPNFANNVFQQQPTGNSFASPSVQQQPQFTNNNSSSSLNQYMYHQPSPQVVPLQSVLPPPLAPQLTASSYQSTVSSFGSPQIQHQTTGAASGRNWANATPDNPFGSGALNNPAMVQQQQQQPNYGIPPQNTGFVPQQHYGNHAQIDPTDKYAVFKTVNTSTPSVFNNQQQQQQPPQQQRSFYY